MVASPNNSFCTVGRESRSQKSRDCENAIAAAEHELGCLEALLGLRSGADCSSVVNKLSTILDGPAFVMQETSAEDQPRIVTVQTRAANLMRKLKRVDVALKLARRAYASASGNIWVVRAYGWALRDAIKDAKAKKEGKSALELVLEFDRLLIPDSEELLLEQRAHYHVGLVGTEQHLAEAFRVAKQKWSDYPGDPKVAEGYFWILADCIEQAIWLKRYDLAKQFHEEILRLPIRGEKQKVKLDAMMHKMDPAYAMCRDAAAISRQGDHVKAAEVYREALRLTSASEGAQKGLGWELARLLNAEVGKAKPDVKIVQAMLREYMSLHLVEKPSLVHSWVLASATRVAEELGHSYYRFAKEWDLKNLRSEDFRPYQAEKSPTEVSGVSGKHAPKEFPSLAEKVGMAIGRVGKRLKYNELLPGVDLAWAVDAMGMLAERFAAHPWLSYYYAVLLLKTDAKAAARERLLPLVRARQGEFWVWAALAETYPPKSRDRLSCLCRANSSADAADPAMTGRMKRNLRDALRDAGHPDAVSYVEAQIGLRKGTFVDNVFDEPSSKVASAATAAVALPPVSPRPVEDVRILLQDYAAEADALILADLPLVPAMVSGVMVAKPGIKGCAFITAKDVGQELRVPLKRFDCLQNVRMGMPLSVRLAPVEGRLVVVSMVPREAGPWDLIAPRLGVVSQINESKGIAVITTGIDRVLLAYFDCFPEARSLKPGDGVEVRSQGAHGAGMERIVWLRHVGAPVPSEFVKSFHDVFRKSAGAPFGFAGDVFIPPTLVSGLEVGMCLSGWAILETSRKTARKGWRALTAENE